MPSIKDIPTDLLKPNKRPQFINWVSQYKGTDYDRRLLIHAYANHTNIHFTIPQMAIMLAENDYGNVI